MSIGLSPHLTEVKTLRDPAAGLIFPVIEPWIDSALDRALDAHQPAPRRCDLLSPLRMLRFELLHASRPNCSFQETFREVWQAWSLAGCVQGSLPSSSALAQARARLPLWALKSLFKHTAALTDRTGHMPCWPHHRLLAIDGTPLALPNNVALREHFGTTRHQNGEAYFPQGLAVWVSHIHTQTVIAEYLGTSREGDESVAPRLLPAVLRPGDLLLGDGHFGHYPTLSAVEAARAFYLVRAPGPLHVQKHILTHHAPGDADVRLDLSAYIHRKHPALKFPGHLFARALCYTIPARDILNGVEKAYFLTNLPRAAYSHADLSPLPALRWNHETLNNDIKSRLGLGELRSLSPDRTHAEVLAHLCLANIIRLTLWQIQPATPLLGSFTAGLSAIRQANPQLRMAPQQRQQITETMCQMMLDQPVIPRPQRSEPRMTRPRRRPYPIFKSARDEWRQKRKVG